MCRRREENGKGSSSAKLFSVLIVALYRLFTLINDSINMRLGKTLSNCLLVSF